MIPTRTATWPLISAEDLVAWINRGLEVLWLLVVVLVPLAFVTRGDLISASAIAYLEMPKIALLRTLVGLMAILWLIEWGVQARFSIGPLFDNRSFRPKPGAWLAALGGWLRHQPTRWLNLAAAIYLATVLLSTVLSTSFAVSMWGEVPGEDGYATYTIIAYVLLFGVIATHLKARAQVWRLLAAIAVVGVLVAGYGMSQHYGFDPLDLRFPENTSRATSTMGNAILAGAVMVMTIPITLIAATIHLRGPVKTTGFWWKLGLWALVLAIQLLGLIFTESRGPWMGTVLALVALVGLASVFASWRYLLRIAMVLALSAVLSSAVWFLPPRLERIDAPDSETTSSSIPNNTPSSTTPSSTTPSSTTPSNTLGSTTPSSTPELAPGSEAPEVLALSSSGVASSGFSGRVEIWKDSWRLIRHRPWFAFDDLSLPYLRPLIGYGPDLFRYTYLLESSPRGGNLFPAGAAHAHNYFIHQGVEVGLLGFLSSLGIFVALFLVGGYLLLRGGRNYDVIHKLILIGLLATLAGRFLEQMVGLARASDLTVFWVVLALFAALPAVMRSPEQIPESVSRTSDVHNSRGLFRANMKRSNVRQRVLLLTLVAGLAIGIGTLTWVKTVNYPRAALLAAESVAQTQEGNLQGALSSLDRAISLAPDIWINYNRRAAVYSAYRSNGMVTNESECSVGAEEANYETCLAKQAYLDNLAGAQERRFNYRSQQVLANSAFDLAVLSGDSGLLHTSQGLFQEVVDLVPSAWPLYNQLAAVYLKSGQPEAALETLEASLALTEDHPNASFARVLRGVAYRDLGQHVKAVQEFDEAIRVSPTNLQAYNNRAMTFWILGNTKRALEDLNEAIRIHPDDIEALSIRGFSYRELGQPKRAIEDLDLAILLDPEHAIAYNNRGLAYSDQGDHLQAIQDYNESIRVNPDYVLAYVNRGLSWIELGEPEKAVLDSQQALVIDPSNPRAYALRAIGYTLLGRDTEASQDTERAVELGIGRNFLEGRIRDLRNQR